MNTLPGLDGPPGPDPLAAFLSCALLVAVLAVAGWYVSTRVGGHEDRRFRGRLFLASFGLRLLFAMVLLYLIPTWVHDHPYLSFGFMGDDGRLYERLAANAAPWDFGWIANSRQPVPSPGYVFFLSVMYWVFGHIVFVLRVVNAFLGALLPAFTYAMGRKFLSARDARLAAILLAVYPEQIIYSGSDLKDISVTTAFTLGLWALSELPESRARGTLPRWLALLVVCTAYLALSRFYCAFILAFGAATYTRGTGTARRPFLAVATRVVLVASIMVPLLFILQRLSPEGFSRLANPVAVASRYYSAMVVADADSFLRYLEPPYNLIFLPVTIAVVALTPFVLWPFVSPDPLFTVLFPAILAWYLVMPFTIYGFLAVKRQGFPRVLFVVVVVAFVVLAVSGSGLGTSGRTKVPLHPVFMMYAAMGFRAFAARRLAMRNMLVAYGAVMVMGLMVYALVKAPELFLGATGGLLVLMVYIAAYRGGWWRRFSG